MGRGRCRFWCVFNSRPIIKTDSHKIRTWLMQRLRGSYVINVNVIHNIIIYDARTYTRICIRRIVSIVYVFIYGCNHKMAIMSLPVCMFVRIRVSVYIMLEMLHLVIYWCIVYANFMHVRPSVRRNVV